MNHAAVAALVQRLSHRQRECLVLVEQRLTSKEIGRALNLSPSTVDNHIRAAIVRLDASGRTEAARMVCEHLDKHDVSVCSEGSGSQAAALLDPTPQRLVPREWLMRPPLGGRPNTLGTQRRFFHVVQLALLATMVFAGLVATIAGVVRMVARV